MSRFSSRRSGLLYIVVFILMLCCYFSMNWGVEGVEELAVDKELRYLYDVKPTPDGDHDFKASQRPSVVAFWHIFAGLTHYPDINKEQRFVLESSGLMDKLDIVYYVTIGKDGASYRVPGPKMKHLHYAGEKGFEIPTLNLIYRFCGSNPNSKVLYFHNKGSGNFHPTNTNFRKALDCFVLNANCIAALDDHDVCGMRFSPVPSVHYSGNYWWATCRHIRRLIPPKAPLRNATFLSMTSELNARKSGPTDYAFHNDFRLGFGRYFAETWVGSLPAFRPADCIRYENDSNYIFGSGIPFQLGKKVCPSWTPEFQSMVGRYHMHNNIIQRGETNDTPRRPVPKLSFGLPCGASDMAQHPEKFRSSERVRKWVNKNAPHAPKIIQRSLIWYGRKPETYLQWLHRYYEDHPVPTVEGSNRNMTTMKKLMSDKSIERRAQKIIQMHQI